MNIEIVELDAKNISGLRFDVGPSGQTTRRMFEQRPGRHRTTGRIEGVFPEKRLMGRMRGVSLILIDPGCGRVLKIVNIVGRVHEAVWACGDGADIRRPRHHHEVSVAARNVERIIRHQRDIDRPIVAFGEEIEPMIEELAEHREPRVEWRGQAFVRRDVLNEQIFNEQRICNAVHEARLHRLQGGAGGLQRIEARYRRKIRRALIDNQIRNNARVRVNHIAADSGLPGDRCVPGHGIVGIGNRAARSETHYVAVEVVTKILREQARENSVGGAELRLPREQIIKAAIDGA